MGLGLTSIGLYLDHQMQVWISSEFRESLEHEQRLIQHFARLHTQELPVFEKELRTSYLSRPEVNVVLFNEEGKPFHRDKSTELPAQFTQLGTKELQDLNSTGTRQAEVIDEEDLYIIQDTVLQHSGETLLLRLIVDGSELQRKVGSTRTIIFFLFLSFFVVGILLARMGSVHTYRNLRRMLRQVRPIAKALAARPKLQTKRDEMATIAKSVRKLASNMEQTVSDLAEERNRFSTVLEGMDTGVMSLNREHVITMANPSAQELLSPKQPLIGLPLSDVLKTDSFHDLVKEAWTLGSSVREIELAGPTRRIIRVHGTANESADTLILVMDEITQLKTLETVREDFVANVSHELRTPVSVIHANAETLLAGAMNDEENGPMFMEAILRNAKRLGQLITDLLDLAQLDSGSYHVDQVKIAIAHSVDNALDALSAKAEKKGMHLSRQWDDGHLVWGDERACTQVVSNFLDNAIKYTPENGEIIIRSIESPNSVRIEVEDNGPGIEPRHHTRLFERFYRVDTGRSRQLGGTGLGLSIVKHLGLSMGGKVGMRAAKESGSVFWLELPNAKLEYKSLLDSGGEK